MTKLKKTVSLITLVISLTGCSVGGIKSSNDIYIRNKQINGEQKIKNVILFIGDGMGPNHVDAGGIAKGEPLCFDQVTEDWAYHAYANTDSLSSAAYTLDETKTLLRPEENESLHEGYTDSAAGGTALATGSKVTNYRVALDSEGNELETLVDISKALDKKAGVISSDTIVGATPSAFYAHANDRNDKDDLITTAAESPVDLILTKNDVGFKGRQEEYEELYKSNGFDNIAYKVEDLNSDADRILGLFEGVVTAQNDARGVPTLRDLTVFALDYLDNEEGFFLMVEGANIDKVSHNNQAKSMLKELLAFDEAIEAAMEWAENRDDTIMVVTADHETGGLYYDRENVTQENIGNSIKWLSGNHTRTRVDIAVYGNIDEFTNYYSSLFKTLEGVPYWDNTDVFKLCASYL